MSTAPPTPLPPGTDESRSGPREIYVYSHTKLFYFWPIWVLGYVFAVWTYFDGGHAVIVPGGSKVEKDKPQVGMFTVIAPKATLQLAEGAESAGEAFPLRMAQNRSLGVIFVFVLLLVIMITNIPLRGLWSVIVLVSLGALVLLFSLFEVWDVIFRSLFGLHIHINMGGYFVMATGLLGLWLFTMYFFDRQVYMIFTPGQLRVCQEIGGGEQVYDTMGMTITKQRDDLFRHWVLGLGTGDMIVRTSGADSHVIHFENVLNINSKLTQINDLIREKTIVTRK